MAILGWLLGRGGKVGADDGAAAERRRARVPDRPWMEDPEALDGAAMIGGVVFGGLLYLACSLLASGGP